MSNGQHNAMAEKVYQEYLSALLAGDRAGCAEGVFHLIDGGIATETLYTDLFQRSLYQIGDLWEEGRISVAVEHLATAITEQLIATVYPRILGAQEKTGRKAVVSCSVNEYHQVGARMVADVMESRGWDTWFLGANTPMDDLLLMVQEIKPDALGLSISIFFNMMPFVKTVEVVRTHFPQLDIFVGGQAFNVGGKEMIKPFEKTAYIPSLQAMIATLSPGGNR